MGVERPEREGVVVNVETMGGAAAELRSLQGLTDWAGNENIGLSFGSKAAFTPAGRLGEVHDTAMRIAWGVAGRIEKVNRRYAKALADAAEMYGATDRHSARAVAAAAEGMAAPSVDG